MTVFTIGYGGLEPSALVRVLTQWAVASVVDVRIWPIRASMGAYVLAKAVDKGIQRLLSDAGIAYFSFLELGNPFKDLPDWQDRYRRLVDSAGDVLVERFRRVPVPACLLCAERRPDECHRSILAEFLERRGYTIHHL